MNKIKMLSSTYFLLICFVLILVFAYLEYVLENARIPKEFYDRALYRGFSKTVAFVYVVPIVFAVFALLSLAYYAIRNKFYPDEDSSASLEQMISKIARNRAVFFYIALFSGFVSGLFLHVHCASYVAEIDRSLGTLSLILNSAPNGGEISRTYMLYLDIHLFFAVVSSIFFLLTANLFIREKLYGKQIRKEA